ncbi:uncharacterized protein [Centruroides vittatus]|uniref:uncharacterized protein n=1 Tax=Centruroides vittatus TaxID=120091 RepID=UPI00350FB5CF
MKRNSNLSLRILEATSAARAVGFNKVAITAFFELLSSVVNKHKLTPERIYDCDETEISCVPKSKGRIISVKGRRQVGALTSAKRGQTVTVEVYFNAASTYLLPMFVYLRLRMKQELLNGAAPGTWAECHSSGWMQGNIFISWFKRFVKLSRASKERPVLLLLDGHSTHTKNIELIDMLETMTLYYCFPPHCTHRLQPLDVAFMKPLSTYYDQEVTKWLRCNPGWVVGVFQIAELWKCFS